MPKNIPCDVCWVSEMNRIWHSSAELLRSTRWNTNLILTCDVAELVYLCELTFWKTHMLVRTAKWPPRIIFCRKLRTDTNCPAGKSWPNYVKNEQNIGSWFGHDFPGGQFASVRSFLIAATTRYSDFFLLSLVTRFACDIGQLAKIWISVSSEVITICIQWVCEYQSTSWILHSFEETQQGRNSCPRLQFGFQFGRVVAPLSFLRSISLASLFTSLSIFGWSDLLQTYVNRQHFRLSVETVVFGYICWFSSSCDRNGQSYPVEYRILFGNGGRVLWRKDP